MATVGVVEPRPWTFGGGRTKQRPVKLKTPQINTYFRQIQKCQELYAKLKLETTNKKHDTSTPTFPKIHARDQTFLSLHTKVSNGSYDNRNFEKESQKTLSSEDIHRLDADKRRCVRMNPKRLCEYLKLKGFGDPRVSTSSYLKRLNETVLNPSPKPFFKVLTKSNKSIRENLKHQVNNTVKATPAKDNLDGPVNLVKPVAKFSQKDSASQLMGEVVLAPSSLNVVKSPLSRKEQFRRIEAWLEDVHRAQSESAGTDTVDLETELQENLVLDNYSISRNNSF